MLGTVTIEGGLVRQPEVRFGTTGKAWAKCRIASKDRVRGADGGWTDGETTFIDVVVFGRQAENLVESATVGDTIVVHGKLRSSEWETPEGEKRTSYEVVADIVGVSLLWEAVKTRRVAAEAGAASGIQTGGPATSVAASGSGWGSSPADDPAPF